MVLPGQGLRGREKEHLPPRSDHRKGSRHGHRCLPCTHISLEEATHRNRAGEVFQNHLSAANHLGLLSEEVDPASGTPLGNTPQAFSHLGLIQAAVRLDRALRLRDEKLDDPPFLEFDFPSLS